MPHITTPVQKTQVLHYITPQQLHESREHLPECIKTSTTNYGMSTPANKQHGSSSLSSVTALDAVNSSDSEDVVIVTVNTVTSSVAFRNVRNNNRKENSPPMLGLAKW